MEKGMVEHLAMLARIALTDEEKQMLDHDITEILGYVSVVTEVAGKEKEKTAVGLVNVMREDVETHAPGEFTEVLLEAAPKRHGKYVEVKKILGGDSTG